MKALEELTILASKPVNPAIEEWKAEGKKVVGFFCTYVPEEILYAANILPYRVRAVGCKQTSSVVTGVQTCALPIFHRYASQSQR